MHQILRCLSPSCKMALDPKGEMGPGVELVDQPGLATKRKACGACKTGRLRVEVVDAREWRNIVARWQRLSNESEDSRWNSAQNCFRRDE